MTAMICQAYLYIYCIYNCIFVMLFCKKLCLVFEHDLFTYWFSVISFWLMTVWRQSMFVQQTAWWQSLQRRELLACLAWSHRHGLLSGHFCIFFLSFSFLFHLYSSATKPIPNASLRVPSAEVRRTALSLKQTIDDKCIYMRGSLVIWHDGLMAES